MDVSEARRPRFHFTPERNWMNDPNGLTYYEGEYHLFYQHNPYGKEWGHMSWGHAVSSDLVHWTHLPIVLVEEPENSVTIFSGSAVVDWGNTSGFGGDGRPPIVAAYTADHGPDQRLQDIHIASSTDRGRTFTKYVGNPVLDVGERKFGDPKVFRHEASGRWIMVDICGSEQGRVVLYGSADLKSWELLSEFRAPDEAPGMWECPDLFPLPLDGDPQKIKWVLKVNCVDSERAAWGSRFFVGDFDGYTFQNAVPTARPLRPDQDDLYAEVTWNDIPEADGRRILIGWVRQQPSETRPWTGLQSIPRVLTLRSDPDGPQVCQAPVAELRALRGAHWAFQRVPLTREPITREPVTGDFALQSVVDASGAEWEIVAEFEPGSAAEFGLRLRLAGGGEATVGYSAGGLTAVSGELFVDRGGQDRLAVALPLESGLMRLHVFIDRSVVEVFGGGGEAVVTAILESHPVCEGLGLYARGGSARLARMDVWKMASPPSLPGRGRGRVKPGLGEPMNGRWGAATARGVR